jgi:hypothetical protein
MRIRFGADISLTALPVPTEDEIAEWFKNNAPPP